MPLERSVCLNISILVYGHDSRIGRIATTFKQNVNKICFLLNKNAWSVSWETDKTCILTEFVAA